MLKHVFLDMPEEQRLERLAADHRSGRAEHGRTLWQMLMLERSLKRLF